MLTTDNGQLTTYHGIRGDHLRLLDPQGAFDLRKVPRGERERFMNSVIRGKNQMPAWGDLLKREDLDALWAYVLSVN